MRKRTPMSRTPDTPDTEVDASTPRGTSRRDFLKSGAVGLAATGLAAEFLPGASSFGRNEGDETLDRLAKN